MEKLSANNKSSRDLLQRFLGSSSENQGVKDDYEDEEIELNLGLSLGGRFGVDKSSNHLVRSSSIAECLPVIRDDNDVMEPTRVGYSGLIRTSSLPVETEEEWRKRKELQTLRRMEAKRRRFEKQRGSRGGVSESLSLEERREIEGNLKGKLEKEKSLVKGLGIDVKMCKGKESCVGGIGELASQESVESKGGSSSTVSDLESKTARGSSGEMSSTSIPSLKGGNQEIGSSATKIQENLGPKTTRSENPGPSKIPGTSRTRGRETGTNPRIEDMPCVFTIGDGPNGRRVDGILYKYGRGEQVRIMCVCCGKFHSPPEFIEHAGGTDLEHPLKHIVINPHSSSLL